MSIRGDRLGFNPFKHREVRQLNGLRDKALGRIAVVGLAPDATFTAELGIDERGQPDTVMLYAWQLFGYSRQLEYDVRYYVVKNVSKPWAKDNTFARLDTDISRRNVGAHESDYTRAMVYATPDVLDFEEFVKRRIIAELGRLTVLPRQAEVAVGQVLHRTT